MSYSALIEDHYTTAWSAPEERLRLARGPVHDLPADFCVLSIPRGGGTHAFATCGMSMPSDAEKLELHLLTRARDAHESKDSLAELLTAVAHYHRTARRLGLGHSVNFGRPWLPRSQCSHGLISLPYFDGPKLEWMNAPHVRFLWLLPITDQELELKKGKGVEALEDLLEQKQLDYFDPLRASVV